MLYAETNSTTFGEALMLEILRQPAMSRFCFFAKDSFPSGSSDKTGCASQTPSTADLDFSFTRRQERTGAVGEAEKNFKDFYVLDQRSFLIFVKIRQEYGTFEVILTLFVPSLHSKILVKIAIRK